MNKWNRKFYGCRMANFIVKSRFLQIQFVPNSGDFKVSNLDYQEITRICKDTLSLDIESKEHIALKYERKEVITSAANWSLHGSFITTDIHAGSYSDFLLSFFVRDKCLFSLSFFYILILSTALSIFSPLKMISIKIRETPRSWHAKCSLPIAIHI